jgi:hypothetical protein
LISPTITAHRGAPASGEEKKLRPESSKLLASQSDLVPDAHGFEARQ